MADAGTVVVTHDKSSRIKVLTYDWTATAGGVVEKTTNNDPIEGRILAIGAKRGAPTPTAAYDITIEDDNGVDILAGAGANMLDAANEAKAVTFATKTTKHVFKVAAAGVSTKATTYVFYQ